MTTVNIRYGAGCGECGAFMERGQYGARLGSLGTLCVKCVGVLAANLTIIKWKATDIGHLSSSAIGSAELIGIAGVEDALQAITELSNEIAALVNLAPSAISVESGGKRALAAIEKGE
jgi:hypothetical protein